MKYQDITRWATWWANRYSWAVKDRGDIDKEDIYQSAMLGIAEALKCYDESGNWAQWSSFFIRKEIRKTIGIKNGRIPPTAVSLNAPIGDDGENTLLELLADETAPDAQEIAEYNDLQRIVREAVASLQDDQQREVIERTRLNDEPRRIVAADIGVPVARIDSLWNAGRKILSRDKRMRALYDIELRTTYIGRTTAKTFQTTHTSDVERAVMWRERERAKLAQIINNCDMRDTELQLNGQL